MCSSVSAASRYDFGSIPNLWTCFLICKTGTAQHLHHKQKTQARKFSFVLGSVLVVICFWDRVSLVLGVLELWDSMLTSPTPDVRATNRDSIPVGTLNWWRAMPGGQEVDGGWSWAHVVWSLPSVEESGWLSNTCKRQDWALKRIPRLSWWSPSESMCAESEFGDAKRCGQEDKSVCMLYTAWSTVQLLSVAMTNTLAKSNLGEERIYLAYASRPQSIIEGSQGRRDTR